VHEDHHVEADNNGDDQENVSGGFHAITAKRYRVSTIAQGVTSGKK
jgi:hypothetical protein